MAAKKNKAKNPSKTSKWFEFWLELPQEILQLLSTNHRKKSNPLHGMINATGVTKSWVPTTIRCGGHERQPPQLGRVDESAYLKYFPGECPFTAERAGKVDRDITDYSHGQLLGAQYERTLVDLLSVRRDPLFQNTKILDFTSMVYLEGKNYDLSLQGILVVVETFDSRRTITGAASNRAVPSLSCRFFKEYLVECDGEIILILFVHQKSLAILDGIEVFRLCLRRLKWIKAEMIGGKVLFLDPRFIWGNSAEIGCKGDCIYFTQASFSGWLVFDMESGSISYV